MKPPTVHRSTTGADGSLTVHEFYFKGLTFE